MKCPLCNKILTYDSLYDIYYCPLTKEDFYSHYSLECLTICMMVPPYRIITYSTHSIVEKYDESIREFIFLFDTRNLNIDRILPKSSQELLSRVETILVFS